MVKRNLADFKPLTQAEQTLLDGLDSGEVVVIGDGEVPPKGAGDDRVIHAEFLRYLILGGCDGLGQAGHCQHEKGLRLAGARITGLLDLQACRIEADLCLFSCRFDQPPLLLGTLIRSLNFYGSTLPGLNADGLEAKGGVFLRHVESQGEIRLPGATLGGDLSCTGARLTAGKTGIALNADALEAKGSVFLQQVESQGEIRLLGATLGGVLACVGARLTVGETGIALNADGLEAKGDVFLRQVESHGEIRLPGATLGGNLDCDGARLMAGETGRALSADGLEAKGRVFLRQVKSHGEIRLLGATLGGDLDCEGATLTAGETGIALSIQSARIKGTAFFHGLKKLSGVLDLTAAEIGQIVDDKESWPEPGLLALDRCRYGGFVGISPVSGAERIDWLSRQDRSQMGAAFEPQPWEQCAKVLHDMGHEDAAREVLIEKEKRQRRVGTWKGATFGRAMAWLAVVFTLAAVMWESGSLAGFVILAGAVSFITVLTMPAARNQLLRVLIAYGHKPRRAFWWLAFVWFLGGMVFQAASDAGQIKPNAVRAVMSADWVGCTGRENPVLCFRETPTGGSYPRFNAWVYSADTLLPIVDLEVQNYWIPAEEAGALGAFARWYLWFQIAAGWALSLLAVAGFSGLIRGR